jgi:quercetin dioxygenase-like cupin family protein
MDSEIVHTDDVPVTDLSEIEEIPPDLDMRSLGDALETDEMNVNVWYFDSGEEITYHAHSEQEELYYVLTGEFEVTVGRAGEEETHEVGPGTFYAAGPEIGHGHRYLGDEQGIILAIGAPAVDDPGLDPHDLD